jgi:diadenylate cyclase
MDRNFGYGGHAMGKRNASIFVETIRAAVAMASRPVFDHLLYVGDQQIPEDLFRGRPAARRKLSQAVASSTQRAVIESSGVPVLPVPSFDLGRAEKMKLALVSGIARGLFHEGDVVVGLLSRTPAAMPDSILVVTVGEEVNDGSFGFLQAQGVSAAVFDAMFDLAVRIGVEGWEGRPVGALFVVGDSATVMEKSRQLTLNPFQGYSEDERNIMREDGVVVAAGRYLNFDRGREVTVPLGLGARHMAAAGISRDSDAIAIVVSQTSGSVRAFRRGKVALELAPRMRRS